MKYCRALVMLVLVGISSAAFAMVPPAYLSVPEWQSCTSTMQRGSADYVCLPKHRPAACPRSSWRKLVNRNMLPFCRRH